MSPKQSFLKRAKNLINTVFKRVDEDFSASDHTHTTKLYKSPYRSSNDLQQKFNLLQKNVRPEKIVSVSAIIESMPSRILKKRRSSRKGKVNLKTPKLEEKTPENKSVFIDIVTPSESSTISKANKGSNEIVTDESLTSINRQVSSTNTQHKRNNTDVCKVSSLTDLSAACRRSLSDFELPISIWQITSDINDISEESFKCIELTNTFRKQVSETSNINTEKIIDSYDGTLRSIEYSWPSLNSTASSSSKDSANHTYVSDSTLTQNSADKANAFYVPERCNDTYIEDEPFSNSLHSGQAITHIRQQEKSSDTYIEDEPLSNSLQSAQDTRQIRQYEINNETYTIYGTSSDSFQSGQDTRQIRQYEINNETYTINNTSCISSTLGESIDSTIVESDPTKSSLGVIWNITDSDYDFDSFPVINGMI
jgi:hypothetical protein